jgi:hypothetical protein
MATKQDRALASFLVGLDDVVEKLSAGSESPLKADRAN